MIFYRHGAGAHMHIYTQQNLHSRQFVSGGQLEAGQPMERHDSTLSPAITVCTLASANKCPRNVSLPLCPNEIILTGFGLRRYSICTVLGAILSHALIISQDLGVFYTLQLQAKCGE